MLNAFQRAKRAGKLTGSRIACLMPAAGADREKAKKAIDRLYREMIGEEIEEDLSEVWAVQLGECTESLNLRWFERKIGQLLRRQGDVLIHPLYPWAAVTLDGWYDELQCPVECKHVGGHEPMPVIIDRYQPQCQWAMEITGADRCALSVISGAHEPIIEYLERDAGYAAEMLRRGAQFMDCVRTRTPPVELEPAPLPADAAKIYDMTEHEKAEQWQRAAQQWLQVKGAADTAKDNEKVLKSLVPADAKKCFGWGAQITRDRAGRLSLREA